MPVLFHEMNHGVGIISHHSVIDCTFVACLYSCMWEPVAFTTETFREVLLVCVFPFASLSTFSQTVVYL